MNELKTLKDINHINNYDEDEYCNEIINKHFDETVLKQEAIKWVVHCEQDIYHQLDNEQEIQEKCNKGHRCNACSRFIDFFNITEEDLKDGE